MPIKTTSVTRVFRYQGTELPDPLPQSTPEQCLEAMAVAYPQFANAYVEGPSLESGKQVFIVKVAAGTKG